MRIATSKTTNSIDAACVQKIGLPLIVLMENAAQAVFKNIETQNYNNYVIVCGSGNNGGDGFALARQLIIAGKEVKVFLVCNPNSKLSECAAINYNILINLGIKIEILNKAEDICKFKNVIIESQVIIDAILGTGLKRKVEGIFDAVIAAINESKKVIFSIDVPSGLNGDTGKVIGNAVKANKTICFEMYKRGFLNYESFSYIQEVIVEPIGVPSCIMDEFETYEYITDVQFIKDNIKPRKKIGFKSDFGKISILAGSQGFYGAAFIAAESAVKCGGGLVTLITHSDVQNKIASKLTEAMTCNFDDKDRFIKLIKTSDAVAFGPGLGNSQETFELLNEVIENLECPLVLDADGINVMSEKCEKFLIWNKKIIITPHLGEMARLTGFSIDYIRENRIDVAKDFAKANNIVVLLKGYETVITDGFRTYINPTGNSAMATGGMGDCLTGIIASFIGQGMKPLEAAVCGAYIHGYIGDKLSKDLYSVNATDIISNLSSSLKEFI